MRVCVCVCVCVCEVILRKVALCLYQCNTKQLRVAITLTGLMPGFYRLVEGTVMIKS